MDPSIPGEPALAPGGLRGELYWILPLGLTVVGGVAFLMFNQNWGANIAAILALPVEVVGLVFAVLTAKGVTGWGAPRTRIPRSRRRVTVYLSVLILLGSGVVYYFAREPDPYAYLAGDVRIGYVSPGYPGWNEGTGVNQAGFDVDVAKALLNFFPDMKSIEWVPLESNDDRLSAFGGPDPVKLVVSNFSITEQRKREIDFAGPYFYDVGGYATHDPKATSLSDVHQACVPTGSTAATRLGKLGIDTVFAPTVRACFQLFFDGNHPDLAVATDLSIVQAYVGSLPTDRRKQVGAFVSDGGIERYGVGLPNNSPRLCAKINEALTEYLRVRWAADFDATLGKLGVNRTDKGEKLDRKPERTDACEPAAPWRK